MAGQPSSTSGAGKSPCKARPNDGTLILPLARIKTIMKSSPDVENISSDALYHVTKATVSIESVCHSQGNGNSTHSPIGSPFQSPSSH